ncbi:hypothetical protein ACROYT_G002199 [Oculina patagonica]
MSSVPQKGKLNDLTNAGRLKEIGFFKHHSAKEIGRLLLATFPALLGIDLKRITFIKSNNKGHAMDDIRHGLMSGDDLVKEYSTNHAKTNVYFVLDDLAATSTDGAQSTVTVDVKTPTPKDGK